MPSQYSSGYTAAEAFSILQSHWIETCCTAAASTLVLYDHITTLKRECQLIWGKALTPIRVLFHLNRWTLLLWAAFSFHSTFFLEGAHASCGILSGINSAFNIILVIIWAAFSTIRVFAISGRRWWMAGVVAALSMAPVALDVFQFVTQPAAQASDVPPLGWTCVTSMDTAITAISVRFDIRIRVCFIASDLFVLVVTVYKTWTLARYNRSCPAPFATVLLRNGIVYFVAMLFFHTFNIVGYELSTFWSPGFYFSSIFLNPVMSITISRYHLSLRQMVYDLDTPSECDLQDGQQGCTQLSSLRFVHDVTHQSVRSEDENEEGSIVDRPEYERDGT